MMTSPPFGKSDPCSAKSRPRADDADDLRLTLAAFVGYAFNVSSPTRALRSIGELHPALQRVAIAAQAAGRAWLAWTDGQRTWFVSAEHFCGADEPAGQRVLRTFFHDSDGRLAASAAWALDTAGRWQLWDR
jgi:hypothetical protein